MAVTSIACEFSCRRDSTHFVAVPQPYPSEKRQSTHYCNSGDLYVDCPTCGRRYFMQDDGIFYCDRPLDVIEQLSPEPEVCQRCGSYDATGQEQLCYRCRKL